MPNSNKVGTYSVSSTIAEEQEIKADAISARYDAFAAGRYNLLTRARDMAALTIPSIMPHESAQEQDEFTTPFQSIGARSVNNLANKLLLTLFPVSTPFFKLEVSEGIIQQLEEQDKNIKNEIENKLMSMEKIIQSDMEVSAFRTRLFEVLRALIVVGNYLLYVPNEGAPVGYRMDQYVVKRSVRGDVIELILRETLAFEDLEDTWVEQLKAADAFNFTKKDTTAVSQPELYTRVYLKDDFYHESKYINGVELEGTDAKYPKEASAWLPLRWNGLSGEDYGRAYVEEYLGDFRSIEGLRKSLLEHAAITAKTFGVIRPGSNMTPQDLATVANGGFVVGEMEDLGFPEVGKYNDMQVTQTQYEHIVEAVSRAFLLTQVRDSERTTAEEIRMQASELETALGGAYSLFAVTFQQPLLLREIDRLKTAKLLPKIDDKAVEPKVIVGMEGLGRGTDLDRFMRAAAALAQLAPSFQLIPDIDPNAAVQFVFNSVGFDGDLILMSDEAKKARADAEQAAQQAEQTQGMMQEVVKQGTKPMIEKGVDNPEGTANLMQAAQGSMQQLQQGQ